MSQGDVEILLARELRKAGIGLVRLSVRRRTPLPEEIGRWVLVLEGSFSTRGRRDRVLIECQSRTIPVGRALVQALAEAVGELEDVEEGMIVATSGYDPDAVALAEDRGIALLALVDGAAAWRSSPWGVAGHPPAWFPEVAAQVIGLSEFGEVRARLIEADRPDAILEKLRAQPRPSGTERGERGTQATPG